ncbi:MAG: SUMF1/EgtB/PvdO family nonheme iron enzyme, partial [Bacteroidota bacterium]
LRQQQLKDLHPHFTARDVLDAQECFIDTFSQSIAPSVEQDPNSHHAFAPREALIPYFLERGFPYKISYDPNLDDERFYLILGDSGMGKTTFMINLFLRYHAYQREDKYPIKLIRFGNKDSFEEIKKMVNDSSIHHQDYILLMDAFDEDPELSHTYYEERLSQWIDLVKGFREVIITSRTQFFPNEKATTGKLDVSKGNTSNPGHYTFKVVFISPFTQDEIRQYLGKRFPGEDNETVEIRERANKIVNTAPRVMVRPMLLSHIDLFLEEEDMEYQTAVDIYEVMVRKWIGRDASRKLTDEELFRTEQYRFAKRLALYLYQKWERASKLDISRDELRVVSQSWEIQLNEKEKTSESLLNRDADGYIKFSHKSIFEYFLALNIKEGKKKVEEFELHTFDILIRFLAEMELYPEMVKVEGGTFEMSDNYTVTLADFEIGRYPVTQHLWIAVMGSSPSNFKGKILPVEGVSWEDCRVFIQKLNQKTGSNYRLPTEAEWEFAARGGNLSKGFKYAGSNTLDEVGWYKDNSNRTTHPVGQKASNELGLYDMSGNVWEWCQDWYGIYPSGTHTNPQGHESGERRVVRGGGWVNSPQYCRVALRSPYIPSHRGDSIGFRLSRHIEQSP